jgi:glutathione synthase/RimK-type ligase-like ATP-grasp enzyme
MRLTGILRDTSFSPFQHAENDRLILELTQAALKKRGFLSELITESQVGEAPLHAGAVFSMCQGPRANAWLEGLEDRGTLIVNSPRAVKNCYREHLYRAGSPWLAHFPKTRVVSTEAPLPELSFEHGGYWVKRGDVQAMQQGDVVRVTARAELEGVLADFLSRSITSAALQDHIDGKVVKFYGVVNTPFFQCYAEQDKSESPLSVLEARPRLERIVRSVGLDVYGGDVVIDESGAIWVIDVNDWPSFALFRTAAADAIAQRIEARTRRHTQPSSAISMGE